MTHQQSFTRRSAGAGIRRRASVVSLLVYLWVAGIFPVLHASAEQPAAAASVQSGDRGSQGSLPAGHDHLTCHFCSAATTLAGPPATQVALLLPQAAERSTRQAPPAESTALAWAHHALPSRAPPLSPA